MAFVHMRTDSLFGTHTHTKKHRDLSFYMGAVKSSRHALDSKQVAAYFSLDNCLKGLALLCQRLFGITLQQVGVWFCCGESINLAIWPGYIVN